MLHNFLFAELQSGLAVRCAQVQKLKDVDRHKLSMFGFIFGAVLENLQYEESLDEILYLFDFQREVIDPLVNDVFTPLDAVAGGTRPEETGSLLAVLVDWIEALSGSRFYEMELHIDCFFQALQRHVEQKPEFWTLERRRAVWTRDAKAKGELEMRLSVLLHVFGGLLKYETCHVTWPVLWKFMHHFVGIDMHNMKTFAGAVFSDSGPVGV